MSSFSDWIMQTGSDIWSVIVGFRPNDALDILIFAFIIYKAIQLVRETRAGQLVKGILMLLAAYYIVFFLNMNTMSWLLDKALDFGVFALLVVFQPELRRLLEQMGRSRINVLGKSISVEEAVRMHRHAIEATCKACISLQSLKTGALIVFEHRTMLGEVIETGRIVDAEISPDLLSNIFYPKAPLHDGAVIIRYGRIQAAACILPLTQRDEISRELGTRHRAAIGMSEMSDAVVVVVSEETGIISIAHNGVMTRNHDAVTLKEGLTKHLIGETLPEDGNGKRTFWKRWLK